MDRSRFYGMPKLTGKEREEALAEAGPTWTQYFEREFLKWCWGLVVIVVDALLIATFLSPLDLAAMIPALALVTYLQFLGFRYLWYRPDPDRESWHTEFHRTWLRPSRFGIWTPEADRLREGKTPFAEGQGGPDPAEFL
jgi:hypothetical protein